MKRVFFSLAVAATFLAGCQTKPIHQMNYTELKTLADQLDQRCAAQGAGPGTRNYRTCFEIEARAENYTRLANRQRMAATGQAMQNAGAAISANRQRITSCQPTMGGGATCTTY